MNIPIRSEINCKYFRKNFLVKDEGILGVETGKKTIWRGFITADTNKRSGKGS